MGEIFLVRHGQASFGAKNYDQLSKIGVEQSKILGHHFAALQIRFDAVYSGNMDRQKKTAEGIVNGYRDTEIYIPEPIIDEAFNEYDSFAVWDVQVAMMLKKDPTLLDTLKTDPTNKKVFQDVFSKVMKRWVSGRFDVPGMVSWKTFKNTVVSGLNSLVKTCGPSKQIAVFSSAGAICAIVQIALELNDIKTMELSWQVMNASVTRLKYNASKITLSGFNDTTHLELTGDQTLLTYR